MNIFIVENNLVDSIFVEGTTTVKGCCPVGNIFVPDKAKIAFGCRFLKDSHIISTREKPKEWLGEFIDVTVYVNEQFYTAMLGHKSNLLIPVKCLDSSTRKEQESDYNNFIGTMAEIFSKVAVQY